MTVNPTTIEEAHTIYLSAVLNARPRDLPALSSTEAKAARLDHLRATAAAFRAYMAVAIEDTAANLCCYRNAAESFIGTLDDLLSDFDVELNIALDDEPADAP